MTVRASDMTRQKVKGLPHNYINKAVVQVGMNYTNPHSIIASHS